MAETQPTLVQNCRAVGCRDLVPGDALFCTKHDALLPSDLRALLNKHYRPGKKDSKVFTRWLEQALQEILYAQTAGHKWPRSRAFEW